MKSVKLMLASCFLLAIPVLSFSQTFWEISVSPGGMVYYGDLTAPLVTLKEMHVAGQISVKRYFDGQHALRFNLLHGTISGDDHNFDRNYVRGNAFEGKLTEFSVMGELDLKGRKRFSKKLGYQRLVSPYLLLGASLAYSKPDVTYGEADRDDEDADYIDWHIGMPVGAGLKFDANEQVVFGLELSFRFTMSDYLDGTQASGNAYRNDVYAFGGVSAGYRFSKKKLSR